MEPGIPGDQRRGTRRGRRPEPLEPVFRVRQQTGGVLDAALARYESDMNGFIAGLETAQRAADIARFLRQVGAVLDDDTFPGGCFMVNTMVEVGDGIPEVRDRVLAYRRRIEQALHTALVWAEEAGDIEAGSARDRARLLQAALFGAFAASRAGDTTAAAHALRAITRELRRWSSVPSASSGECALRKWEG